ncbi:hypothetical protein [Metallosphaera sedula]|nr:hypothetical protein [Metallosphaera sedula]AKV74188.1 hypothetical protein MsedA_1172 [Metallosphaera sedula]AKV76427.1 hypothetical protein MsedB_1174 [Metallosphaera sedula]AKV78679.1 hypothetical protein MsedC_1172 [Metallosphaera sedula]AKV80924.1 hypothetical protein MsedD_1173 [Metallosphaera sedula]AKV83166.1 hypothetical protein MsedE_1175 [Metallosphaera sedula]
MPHSLEYTVFTNIQLRISSDAENASTKRVEKNIKIKKIEITVKEEKAKVRVWTDQQELDLFAEKLTIDDIKIPTQITISMKSVSEVLSERRLTFEVTKKSLDVAIMEVKLDSSKKLGPLPCYVKFYGKVYHNGTGIIAHELRIYTRIKISRVRYFVTNRDNKNINVRLEYQIENDLDFVVKHVFVPLKNFVIGLMIRDESGTQLSFISRREIMTRLSLDRSLDELNYFVIVPLQGGLKPRQRKILNFEGIEVLPPSKPKEKSGSKEKNEPGTESVFETEFNGDAALGIIIESPSSNKDIVVKSITSKVVKKITSGQEDNQSGQKEIPLNPCNDMKSEESSTPTTVASSNSQPEFYCEPRNCDDYEGQHNIIRSSHRIDLEFRSRGGNISTSSPVTAIISVTYNIVPEKKAQDYLWFLTAFYWLATTTIFGLFVEELSMDLFGFNFLTFVVGLLAGGVAGAFLFFPYYISHVGNLFESDSISFLREAFRRVIRYKFNLALFMVSIFILVISMSLRIYPALLESTPAITVIREVYLDINFALAVILEFSTITSEELEYKSPFEVLTISLLSLILISMFLLLI